MAELPRGKFIVLEGIDGSGKTTQLEALAAWLPISGLMPPGAELVTTRAPGGTALGQRLRELLLHPPANAAPSPIAELLLYVADTAQLVAEVIEPALAAGNWVLCDRFTASTVAYQGYGRGLDLTVRVRQLNRLATGGLEPDLTLWLSLPLADALRRRGHRPADRIEAAGWDFSGQVALGYDSLFAEATNWYHVNASLLPHFVTEQCKQVLRSLLVPTRNSSAFPSHPHNSL